MPQLTPLLKIMDDACRKAGKALIRDFGEVENLQVSLKGPRDFVTSADLRADKILKEELAKSRPDFSFITEESGFIQGKDQENCWIIDPLDGTMNFMHGIPYFCISLALQKTLPNGKKEIVAGIIHAPILQETYWAEKGTGAFMNNRRLLVSARKNIGDALLAVYPSRENNDVAHSIVDAVVKAGCTSRSFGAVALDLAYVAAGKLEGVFHPRLKTWDMAAGILLVREAKGMVSDTDGNDTMMETGRIVATNELLNGDIRRALQSVC